jgi:hypothetical protein
MEHPYAVMRRIFHFTRAYVTTRGSVKVHVYELQPDEGCIPVKALA